MRGRIKLHDKLLGQLMVALRGQAMEQQAEADTVKCVLEVLVKAVLALPTGPLLDEDREALTDYLELVKIPDPLPGEESAEETPETGFINAEVVATGELEPAAF